MAALGAEALAYDDPRLAELEADVVFDPVGAGTFARSVEALGAGGRVVTPGAVGDAQVSFDVWTLMGKRGRILGTGSAPIVPDTIRRLIDLAAEGTHRARDRPGAAARAGGRGPPRDRSAETFGKVILRP